MSEVEVVTFGCRLNSYESEIIRAHARSAGLVDTVVVHTCSVTAEAERQARQTIRRARRDRPDARIVVTGCSAQISSGAYSAMPEVDHVVGNGEKLDPAIWRTLASPSEVAPRALVGDIMSVKATAGHLVEGFDDRTRAFLQVQQGCDHRCTFCIIPYGRGPSRSVSTSEILTQARRLVENGYKELVVTGVDVTSWGKDVDGRPAFGTMLAELLEAVPELPRLRLSSLDPAELDPTLLRLIAEEPRLMPHLHLSVQAGSDMILKRMKRRHSRGDVIACVHQLRSLRPDLIFGADLIAGFPTEDEAMFEDSLALVEEAGLTFLHVFPYSPRPQTPAARMPQVEKAVIKERAARLRAVGDSALERFLAGEVGRRRRVLVENDGRGHTDHFAPLRVVSSDPLLAGTIAEFHIRGVQGGLLQGELAA